MDFTREPIIESVITPKEGCTLAVRSSKGTGQEEYFVDAVEVVTFGNALFFRSLERPKNFLLPVSDYEILEVRETRLVLKNVGLDRSIKIAGGREASLRTVGRGTQEKTEAPVQIAAEAAVQAAPKVQNPEEVEVKGDVKLDKKRDRRRNYKRKKGRDEQLEEEGTKQQEGAAASEKPSIESDNHAEPSKESLVGVALPVVFSSLLPPPSTLISETIARYKDNALFRGAFFTKDETAVESSHAVAAENLEIDHPQLELPHEEDAIELPSISLDLPAYTPPEMSEEEQERIYQERRGLRLKRNRDHLEKVHEQKNELLEDYNETFAPEDTQETLSKNFSDALANHSPEELQEPFEVFVEEKAEEEIDENLVSEDRDENNRKEDNSHDNRD